ncbi:FAD/NAD(P)-binding domain-containing protein [Coniochaeta ligniaria NRRL 30616]|uniref:FAD/NAD(P)-binding domain-containing protein n=1 Tax=Coniochaeta ligniaria NRRL 30616 TaxID=1408157 RepID=A0A1J7J589_9PEZI|nr:FAD/NAD(P)-binding domain-containing protein [Coniochaeta ligniaria NRRL 30616]
MDTVKAVLNGHAPLANGNHEGPKDGFSPLVDECETPLKIAIIGAGIGGLSAAIGLRRNGHQVELYEQSRFANEVGAAVHLAPNSNGILRRWGIYAEQFGGNPMTHLVEFSQDGQVMKKADLREPNKRWQHPWLLVHRVSLHDQLKKLATSEEGEGIPAKLHTASKVVEIDPEKGTLTLETGETSTADIIVGADGVYSLTRKYIKDAKPFSSGKAAFRFLIPRSVAQTDPITQPLVADKGALLMWYSDDRRIVMYPCNDNEMLNFVCIHPDTESHATKGDEWNKQASIEQVLKVYENFDPAIKALISKVEPSSIKVWQLLDMEKLETWTKGKLVLLGDAAHPFTPHQGQGAGQAMEDAAALTVVLPRGTAPEAIPERLKLYEEIRYERAHVIQDYSRKAGQNMVAGKPAIDMMQYTSYNFGHDEFDHASNIFKRWKWAKKPDMYWRMPIAFGPFPGPRMDALGRRRLADGPTRRFTTASIKFKTSRTFLESLLPTSQFSFASPDTVATASFSVTRLDKMAWLAGEGYTHFGLYVHGVRYTKRDGTAVTGTYLPILFESLTDPIVSGREELGMPKLFCDVEMHNRSRSTHISASWRGATFANLSVSNLVEDDPATEHGTIGGEADYGILVYRYIPAVGRPGVADAEYACVVPHEEEAKVQGATVERVWRAKEPGKTARVDIRGLDWDALPTLHHVADVLARVPVYEVLAAKVVEGRGVPDVMAARRIE